MRGEVKWEIVAWLRSKWQWKNYVVSKNIYIRFLISWLTLPFYQIFSTFGLFVKLIKNYYSIFFFTICFCLHLCYPFDEIITGEYVVFKKYNNIIFFIIHAIFWGHDTSRSVVFYEIIFWRHRSRFIVYMLNKRRKRKKTEKNTQDTFF